MAINLTTVNEVIDALGGNAEAAEALGVGYTSVTNWRMFGYFPARTYVQIQSELKRRRKTAPDSLWRMSVASKQSRAG